MDANVLIAGVRMPRWPYEVMRAAVSGYFDLVLPERVVTEAWRHLDHPAQIAALESFLGGSRYEELSSPSLEVVLQHQDLVRSPQDVPIAVASLAGKVDIFVTNDRDFTDPEATAERFRQQVHVVLPALFLRDVVGSSSEALEAIRNRTWDDLIDGPRIEGEER